MSTALLKSHITCPLCGHESITYDPYSSLSLPLPVPYVRRIPITLTPLPHGARPIKFVVTVPLTASVKQLKDFLSARSVDMRALSEKREYIEEVRKILREEKACPQPAADQGSGEHSSAPPTPMTEPSAKLKRLSGAGPAKTKSQTRSTKPMPSSSLRAEKLALESTRPTVNVGCVSWKRKVCWLVCGGRPVPGKRAAICTASVKS